MIKLKFSKFMNGRYNDRGEDHELYVLRGEGCVLYVGISRTGIRNRWFADASSHLYRGRNNELLYNSRVGEAVVRCAPDSMNWVIELWTKEDCIKFLQSQIKDRAMENRLRRDIRFCEDLMIEQLKPCLNIAGAAFRYDNLPEKIRRYTLDQEERALQAYHREFGRD
jgi:hypothetical protein